MNWIFLKQNLEAFIFMLGFSILGGLASYLRKVSDKKASFSISELVGEAVISASAGLTVGLILIDHTPIAITLAATSVAGHMGTRLIYSLEAIITGLIKARFGETTERKPD